MAEVHLSGEFDVIDDYQLRFKGQLKGKARKVRYQQTMALRQT
jgi:hypothetical protein